ncbi:TetR family transcriptional regulator [Caballeronia sp. 15715]|jgi:AcrR family transcriptional regulator|uniref:TetR family transcriptional regulator n=1 Tax=unclassified Caballeronia TaxID=2646786 RepID=UPI0039E5406E
MTIDVEVPPPRTRAPRPQKSPKAATGGRKAAIDDDASSAAQILRAAASAFMVKGYAATSIDDVADVLGCTKGRIYYSFKSKTDLFFEVHREAMQMIMTETGKAAENVADPIQRIAAMSRAHVLVIMKNIEFQCVVVQGLDMHMHGQITPQQRKSLRELLAMRDRYEAMFVEAIEEAMRRETLPNQDAHVVVKALLGALNWTTIWYRPRRGETAAGRSATADGVVGFCVRGLGAPYAA